ncbi:MAG: hypothetical protein H5T24_07795 [Bacteroidales bacterium]|nr:hypothetical protein [Bacteroidales bacterium]
MTFEKKNTGFAIAIAWPDTYCRQANSWYDGLLKFLGISHNHYYKAGHAALVLVNSQTLKCHYFDFGRYHAPWGYGRVRSEVTDTGLKVNTTAKISSDGKRILNLVAILKELQLNAECHGEGKLYASYCKINFQKAFEKAMWLQQISPIRYGPFQYKGSNCSRFVAITILAGKPHWWNFFRMKYLVPLTPTPLSNVYALKGKIVLPIMRSYIPFCPPPVTDRNILKTTLQEPTKPTIVPNEAQWISGIGAGSWFCIIQESENFRISRYSPEGVLECCGLFKIVNGESFDPKSPYRLDHLSHCQKVVVKQSDKVIIFNRLDFEN